jgi:hypothetical protein
LSTRNPEPRTQNSSFLGPASAAFLVVFGFLPIANWIPGGHEAPWYRFVAAGWLSGTAIALGTGVVLTILSRRLTWLWHDGLWERPMAVYAGRSGAAVAVVAVLALALYVLIAQVVFSGRPVFVDEGVQMLQAKIYLSGRLWIPPDPNQEFFTTIHVIDTGGKVYTHFPPGAPAMLALGLLVHAPWLVGPVCATVSVLGWASFLRVAEPRPAVRIGALLLFAAAPFVAFMAGSYMNHVTSLAWILIGVAALAHVVSSEPPRPGVALLLGLGFGIAATIRPVDAFAFALPAGAWILWRTIRDPRRWTELLSSGLGVAVPMLIMLWVNKETTGHPFLFGYEVLWGKIHNLGFHDAPWGGAHTPARGVELVSLYFLRLQTYLFETAIPSLLPAIVALALTRSWSGLDRYLLVSAAILVGLYFAYWFDGFYLGPRFVYPLAPVLTLWTARSLAAIRERWGRGGVYKVATYTLIVSGVVGVSTLLPIRFNQYRHGLNSTRWDQHAAAEAAGVSNALVFVRESWGAQLIAKMWALGIPRPDTELLYWNVDACALQEAVDRAQAQGLHGQEALAIFRPLLADSGRVIGSRLSADTTQRMLPGAHYSAKCVRRVLEDRTGFTLYTPMMAADDKTNIYAKELHSRDSLLIQRYPDRKVYLLKPPTDSIGALPRFTPVSLDSARAEWALDRTP